MNNTASQGKTDQPGKIAASYFLVFAGVMVLYAVSCAPGILWQDSGRLVYRVWNNDLEGGLGLAVAHPLYILAGMLVKTIPFGDLARKINLMTALFGAVTVANLFLLVRLWLGRIGPAVIGAVTLAVSWTFWQSSVTTEIYTLYTALLFAELVVLLQFFRTSRVGYLYLLGFLNGLAISNHMLALFGLACYGLFVVILSVQRKIRLSNLGVIILLWVLGAGIYEYLIIKNIVLTGDVVGTLSSAVFGTSWQKAVLNTSVSAKTVFENLIFIALNFPTPNFILFFIGIRVLWKAAPSRSFANILTALLVLYFLFAFRYTVPDRYIFFIPFYGLVSVLIAVGANVLFERFNRKWIFVLMLVFTLLPMSVYFFTPTLARANYKALAQRRQLPYRDAYKYFLQPWKRGYHGTERFVDEALTSVEQNAIIYADTTTVYPLLYAQQVLGRRKDVKIVSTHHSSIGAPELNADTVSGLFRERAVYVVSPRSGYCPVFLRERFDFVAAGVLWRAVEKKETNGYERQV
jgi:hypothetical protein